jgi:putative transcriptional regulator
MTSELTGKLLVASPILTDPNFARTVVFVCAHGEAGAFGLVLNRPGAAAVGEHLPQWMEHVSPPSVFFQGGPVEPDAAFALASVRGEPPAEGWIGVGARLGLVDLGEPPGEIAGELAALRLFRGYAGWSPGQLESELEQQAWFVIAAEPGDPFARATDRLWQDVLRRQPGKLAMFAHFPSDPSLN